MSAFRTSAFRAVPFGVLSSGSPVQSVRESLANHRGRCSQAEAIPAAAVQTLSTSVIT